MAVVGIAMAVVEVFSFGLRGTLVGLVASTLPVPLFVFLVLRRDRNEPEPPKMLVLAFGWGATVAAFLSGVLNTVGFHLFARVFEDPEAGGVVAATIVAPVVEETLKGAVVALIVWRRRNRFNGLVDGIVYASMVGLGFAVAENVSYYAQALAEGLLGAVIVARGIFSPFAHPLFTAMTGIGLSMALERSQRRWVPPVLGLAGAMVLHSLWNASNLTGPLFLVVYVNVFVPIFVAVLLAVSRAARQEQETIRHQLRPEVDSGLLSTGEAAALADISCRVAAAQAAAGARGDPGREMALRFQQAAISLAFARHRALRGDRESVADLEDALRDAVADYRAMRLPALVPPPSVVPWESLPAACLQPADLGAGWEPARERFAVPVPGNMALPTRPIVMAQTAYAWGGPRESGAGGAGRYLVSTNMSFAPGWGPALVAHFESAARAWPAYEQSWLGRGWRTSVTVGPHAPGGGTVLRFSDRETWSGTGWQTVLWVSRVADTVVAVHLLSTKPVSPDDAAWVGLLGSTVCARLGAGARIPG